MGSSTFSRAVSTGMRLKNWKTNPIFFLLMVGRMENSLPRKPLVMSIPSMKILPSVGRESPPRRLRRVDLPDPDGPTMETNSPRLIWMSIPLTALMIELPIWYLL